eukprot:TRINITY_DN6041_c0_g1_i1.p1 TRINITY_DN6041_c0_g1~~TRINITY_DN6041_c0_g1_i1.p1  ORF type:complete len:398 (-),score=97.58 TRINITY_DN6041_c0_g1_i1:64-1257(-)
MSIPPPPPPFGSKKNAPPPAAAPPPPPPPVQQQDGAGGGKIPAKKWVTMQDTTPKVDVFNLPPCSDISRIDWSHVHHVKLSESGSGGVIFVVLQDVSSSLSSSSSSSQSVVVIKGCLEVAQLMFTTDLARALSIPVPNVRLIQYTHPEWKDIKTKLATSHSCSETVKLKIKKELKRAFFVVMEFVSGQDIDSMQNEKRAEVFNQLNTYHQMGQIIAYDLLINNYDRFPCIWANPGNPRNVIMTKQHTASSSSSFGDQLADTSKWTLWPIDHMPATIRLLDARKAYIDSVRDYLHQIYHAPSVVCPSTLKIEAMLQEYGLAPTHDQLLEVQNGVRDMVARCVSTLSPSLLQSMHDGLAGMVTVDWENHWGGGVQSINIPFMNEVLETMKEVHTTSSPI